MRSQIARAVFMAVSLMPAFAPSLQSPVVLITFDQPLQSQKLAGVVVGPSGATVMGVRVEECDSTFTHVKATAWTDEDGHFALRHGRKGTTHFLCIGRDGPDPMQLTVQLKHSAKPDLKIVLTIAT